MSPLTCVSRSILCVCLLSGPLMAATYYVDYDSGADGKSGTSPDAAWKHAPGDPEAGGRAASVKLQGGDVVQFRGGVVYRGSVVVPASGSADRPIVFKGTGWGEGRAIVDGSESITGWQKCATAADAGGNPNFAEMVFVEVETDEPLSLNLQEREPGTNEDRFLNIAQDPNPADPFFYDRRDSFYPVKQSELTRTSVTAPDVFTSADPDYFKGASMLLWVQPNWTRRLEILSFDPDADRVTFDEIPASAIYADGRDQFYAIYNSVHAIDRAGEYSVGAPDASGKRRIVLWPFFADQLDGRISRSVREQAFQIGAQSHVTIEGFHIRKFAGDGDLGGTAVSSADKGDVETGGLIVRDNVIRNNSAGGKGYGGIFMTKVSGVLIEKNDIQWNKAMRAIFFTDSENVTIRKNHVAHTGRTALVMYGGRRSLILNNRLDHVLATHANAITLYVACENVVVAGNRITNSTNPITFQDSGPLYFINNVADGGGRFNAIDEWGNTKRGPWATGRIVLLNNTLLNSEKASSLNVGKDAEKEYVVINNIVDGMTVGKVGAKVDRSHNLFVRMGAFQNARYGWEPAAGDQVVEDLDTIFVNPSQLDFRLKAGGPAVGVGTDVSAYYPKDIFPDVNFDEIAGVTKPMNIGAEAANTPAP